MKSNRASANMWWIIIGAVIALVVMIILMVMFTGKTKPLEQGLSSCENKGGLCMGVANAQSQDCNKICGEAVPKRAYGGTLFGCNENKCCCIGG